MLVLVINKGKMLQALDQLLAPGIDKETIMDHAFIKNAAALIN